MIRTWLARSAGVAPLVQRIDTLDRDLAAARATILSLHERLADTEARAATARDRLDQEYLVLARVARIGAARLRRLQADGMEHDARVREAERGLTKLAATIAILETRIEEEAEQARRGTMGLFRRIDAMRAPAEPDMPG